MPANRPDGAEGNHAHDDQRLGVGFERYRQQAEDDQQRQRHEIDDLVDRFKLPLALAAEHHFHIEFALPGPGEKRAHFAADLIRRHHGAVNIGADGDDAPAVLAVDE